MQIFVGHTGYTGFLNSERKWEASIKKKKKKENLGSIVDTLVSDRRCFGNTIKKTP